MVIEGKRKKKRKLSFKEIKADGSTKEFHLEEEMAKSGETSEKALEKFLETATK